jgi:NAD(P)H-dependent flavin oxidoreductase YrpB (nitropropane dioxygenase family)
MRTKLCDDLGIEFPIFAFSHCRDVVAAVSRAGGFGVLGALAFDAEQLEIELKWIDQNVDGKPYGVDTVIPASYVGKQQGGMEEVDLEKLLPEEHKEFVESLLAEYGVPELPADEPRARGLLGWSERGGRAHFEVALAHPVKLIANALGPPPVDVIETAHAHDIAVAALVGRAEHALLQVEQGVDIIIASGYEAGGHTGEISTMVLVPEVVDAIAPVPVLAAGGIGSGRQMAAAMALGAQGVWTGSIWLTVREGDYSRELMQKLLDAGSGDTVRSRSLTGKPARQLRTPWIEAWEGPESPGALPMPLQFLLTAEAMRRVQRHARSEHSRASELQGTPVGQIVGRMNAVRSTREVIFELVDEYLTATERLNELARRAERE